MATKVATAPAPPSSSLASKAPIGDGLKAYYQGKIEELELAARDKAATLRRLEAQRNELNSKGEERRRRGGEGGGTDGDDKVMGPRFFKALSAAPAHPRVSVALFSETKAWKRLNRSAERSSHKNARMSEKDSQQVDSGRALLFFFNRVFFSLSSLLSPRLHILAINQPTNSPTPPRGAPAPAGARLLCRRGHQGRGMVFLESEEKEKEPSFDLFSPPFLPTSTSFPFLSFLFF